MPQPPVLIFSSLLLPASQTFIRAQGEALERFTPYYAGSRLVKGLKLPPEHILVANQGNSWGSLTEAVFKLSGFAPRFYQQIQQLNPVLIHAQFGLSGALALPLARSLNLPLLVHFRGADATIQDSHARFASLNHWVYLQRREGLQQEGRLFLTVSKFIQEKLLEQGFPAHKVLVHYSGITISNFTPDPDIVREPIVLFVGRLTEKKGCEYLIQAMAQVQSRLPEMELVLIGDGPLRSPLESLARRVLRRHQFLGVQPTSIVRQWMNRARLLVAPSITSAQGDSEGLPNVVLEAQAMALPVVSTVHAGIPEAVIHGRTGFLAPERDVDLLATYCLKVLQDDTLWQNFSTKGQELVRARFDRSKQTRILEDLYESVLGGELK